MMFLTCDILGEGLWWIGDNAATNKSWMKQQIFGNGRKLIYASTIWDLNIYFNNEGGEL